MDYIAVVCYLQGKPKKRGHSELSGVCATAIESQDISTLIIYSPFEDLYSPYCSSKVMFVSWEYQNFLPSS